MQSSHTRKAIGAEHAQGRRARTLRFGACSAPLILALLLLAGVWRLAHTRPALAEGNPAALVSAARMGEDIAHLQDDPTLPGLDALGSRFSLSPRLDAPAAYIAGQLSGMGLSVSYFSFTATDWVTSTPRVVSNIIATLPGVLPETEGVYILCAHYDSTASRAGNWYSHWPSLPAPGADDNASGTAGVLEAARVLAATPLRYSVRFVLFAGEEQGLQGSQAYAQALRREGARVLGVINLDMIGYDANSDGRMELHTDDNSASQALAAVLTEACARSALPLHPTVKINKVANSDHASFWQQGYPAVLVIEDLNEFTPYYHQPTDSLSTLNLPYAADIVRAAVTALVELAGQEAVDLSSSRQEAALAGPLLSTACYTLTLHNSGAVTATATLTNVLAPELSPLGEPVAARGVAAWDGEGNLRWQGAIGPGEAVTLSCRARLDPFQPGGVWLQTVAQLDDGAGGLHTLPAAVRAPWRLWVPAIYR